MRRASLDENPVDPIGIKITTKRCLDTNSVDDFQPAMKTPTKRSDNMNVMEQQDFDDSENDSDEDENDDGSNYDEETAAEKNAQAEEMEKEEEEEPLLTEKEIIGLDAF